MIMTRTVKKTISCCSLWLLSISFLLACSCRGPQTVAIGWRHADIIVWGEVIDAQPVTSDTLLEWADYIERGDSISPSWMVGQKMEYTIRMVEAYKGVESATTLRIQTGLGGGDCGYTFQIGQHYLIYANRRAKGIPWTVDEGTYSTDICMRTMPYHPTEAQALRQIHDYSVGCRCPKKLLPTVADSTLCKVVDRPPLPRGEDLYRWKTTIRDQIEAPKDRNLYYWVTLVVDEKGALKRIKVKAIDDEPEYAAINQAIAAQLKEVLAQAPPWRAGHCSSHRVPVQLTLLFQI